MKIYLAGPFFNKRERRVIERVRDLLRARGLNVFVPMEHFIENAYELPNDVWAKKVYEVDVGAIEECDIILVVYYGMKSDSGTAFEQGFAKGLNKRIVVVHNYKKNIASLMITNSADYNIYLKDLQNFDFDDLESNKNLFNNEQK